MLELTNIGHGCGGSPQGTGDGSSKGTSCTDGQGRGKAGEGGQKGGSKSQEGGGCRDFELRDVVVAVDGLRTRQDVDKCIFADRSAFPAATREFDTLVEAYQVRGRIDMHARTCRLKHRLQESRNRALAVSAGHVHARGQALVRIAQLGKQQRAPAPMRCPWCALDLRG